MCQVSCNDNGVDECMSKMSGLKTTTYSLAPTYFNVIVCDYSKMISESKMWPYPIFL